MDNGVQQSGAYTGKVLYTHFLYWQYILLKDSFGFDVVCGVSGVLNVPRSTTEGS